MKYNIERNQADWFLDIIEIMIITAVVTIIILSSNSKIKGNNYNTKASLAIAIATSELGEEDNKPAPKPRKVCSCSSQCTCGCNEYQPCRCSEGKVTEETRIIQTPVRVQGETLPPLTTTIMAPQIKTYVQPTYHYRPVAVPFTRVQTLPQGGVRGGC